jgi:hypothetical protein
MVTIKIATNKKNKNQTSKLSRYTHPLLLNEKTVRIMQQEENISPKTGFVGGSP